MLNFGDQTLCSNCGHPSSLQRRIRMTDYVEGDSVLAKHEDIWKVGTVKARVSGTNAYIIEFQNGTSHEINKRRTRPLNDANLSRTSISSMTDPIFPDEQETQIPYPNLLPEASVRTNRSAQGIAFCLPTVGSIVILTFHRHQSQNPVF